MLQTLKYFLSRVYTIISIVLFVLSYGAIKVSAVYYATDNITNPTCAPGAVGCYVSLNTLDQNIRIWNTTNQDTTSIGIGTLALNTITGNDNYNYAIGEESMRYATGGGNYGFGWYTLRGDGITTNSGSRNIGIGEGVLNKLQSGSDNIGIGNASFNSLTTGSFNVSIGRSSQRFLTTGSQNTSLGYGSLINNILGSGNTAFGYNSATSTTGSYNTIIGYGGGQSLSTGSYNIAIGQNVDLPSNTASGQLNIGNLIYGTGVYSGAGGSSTPVTSGMVGIGTSTPTATLDVLYDSTTDERMTFGGIGRLNIVRYGSDQAFRIQRANGTYLSQTHVLSGENIGQFGFEGYRANASFGRTFDISVQASEDYSGSSYGSTASFLKVKTGGSSRYAYMYTDGGNKTGFTSGSSSLSGTIPSTLYVLGEGSTSGTYGFQVQNSTGTNNAFVVRDDGNVGIGTGSPLSRFHINKASTVNSSPTYSFEPLLRLTEDQANSAAEIAMESSNGQGGISFSRSVTSGGVSANSGIFRLKISGSTGIGTHSSIYQILSVGASENWTPTANGIRILFSPIVTGTTSSTSMLAINGDGVTIGTDATTQPTIRFLIRGRGATSSTNSLTIQNSGLSTIFNIRDDGYMTTGASSLSGIVSRFQNSTGTCDINPTTTSLSCSSDRTLKTNITNLNNTILNQITTLQPVTYTWINDNTNQQQTGFIAQDVEQIFPSLVSTDPTTNLKSLNYIGLIPYAIEGIKELDIKINQQASLFNNDQNRLDKIRVFFDNLFGQNKICVDDQTCLTKNDIIILIEIARNNQNNVIQNTSPQDITENVVEDTGGEIIVEEGVVDNSTE